MCKKLAATDERRELMGCAKMVMNNWKGEGERERERENARLRTVRSSLRCKAQVRIRERARTGSVPGSGNEVYTQRRRGRVHGDCFGSSKAWLARGANCPEIRPLSHREDYTRRTWCTVEANTRSTSDEVCLRSSKCA